MAAKGNHQELENEAIMKKGIIAAAALLCLGFYIKSEIRAYDIAAAKTIRIIRDEDQCDEEPISGGWVDEILDERPEGYLLVFEVHDRGTRKTTLRYKVRLLLVDPDGWAYDTVYDINGACVRSWQPDLLSFKKAIVSMLPKGASISDRSFNDMEKKLRGGHDTITILRVNIEK